VVSNEELDIESRCDSAAGFPIVVPRGVLRPCNPILSSAMPSAPEPHPAVTESTREPEATSLSDAAGELRMDMASEGAPGTTTFWRAMIKDNAKGCRRTLRLSSTFAQQDSQPYSSRSHSARNPT